MLTRFSIILLVLYAQSAFAGPLRRFQGISTSPAVEPSTLPISRSNGAPQLTRGSDDSTSADVFAQRFSSQPAPLPSSVLASLLHCHQTAQGPCPIPGSAVPSESPRRSQSLPSSSKEARFTPSPHPNSPHSGGPPPRHFGEHGGPPEEGVTTTTLTVTTTIHPNEHENTVASHSRPAATSDSIAASSPVAPFGSAGAPTPSGRPASQSGAHSSQAHGSGAEPHSAPANGSHFEPNVGHPGPSTTFFVLGSSTLVVTVSTGHGGVPASRAVASASISTVKTTLTRLRTRFSTKTITPAPSSSPAQQIPSSSIPAQKSSAVVTPSSFPSFSFAPTSASGFSPTHWFHPHPTTVLPPIVTPSSSSKLGPSSSSNAPVASASSKTPSQQPSSSQGPPSASQQFPTPSRQPPSASPRFSPTSASSSTIAGITIVPVNPDATTVFVTRTVARETVTVARETFTARPCRGRHCGKRRAGRRAGNGPGNG